MNNDHDEDDQIATKVGKDDTQWEEKPVDPNRKPVIRPLPGSDDPMWEGANIKQVSLEELERQRKVMYDTIKVHKPAMRGQEFICTTCPFEHTIAIDPRAFTIDPSGQVVPIDNTASKSVS